MGLSDGEKKFDDAFSRFDTRHACDNRQTELAWHIRAIAYMLSRVKKNKCDNVENNTVGFFFLVCVCL